MRLLFAFFTAAILLPSHSLAATFEEAASLNIEHTSQCSKFLATDSIDSKALVFEDALVLSDLDLDPPNPPFTTSWTVASRNTYILETNGTKTYVPTPFSQYPLVAVIAVSDDLNRAMAWASSESGGETFFWDRGVGSYALTPWGSGGFGYFTRLSKDGTFAIYVNVLNQREYKYFFATGVSELITRNTPLPSGWALNHTTGSLSSSDEAIEVGTYSFFHPGIGPVGSLTAQAIYWDSSGVGHPFGPYYSELGSVPGWPYPNGSSEGYFKTYAISPDGKYVAGYYSLPNDYSLKLWSLAGGFSDISGQIDPLEDAVYVVTNGAIHISGRYKEPFPYIGPSYGFITDPVLGKTTVGEFLTANGVNTSAYLPESLDIVWISPDRSKFRGRAISTDGRCVVFEFTTEPSGPPPPTEGQYGLWNSFLDMRNVLELTNNTDFVQNVLVRIFRIDGSVASEHNFTLAARSQQDVVLDTLPGVFKDSYGLVNVVGDVSGRVTYYRDPDGAFSNFDFAFGIELSSPLSGESFLTFNTNQPSFYGPDLGNLVANWLSLVNLSSTVGSFRVEKFGFNGEAISDETFFVPAFGRLDVDGGHINPGLNKVGLIKVTSSVPYTTQLSRYGYGSNNSFDFAFPIIGKDTASSDIHVAMSTRVNAQNWLEVANTTDESVFATIRYYSPTGALLDTSVQSIPAFSQRHISVNAIYGEGARGHASISSSSPGALIANSMYYFRDEKGAILTMFGSQAAPSQAQTLTGTYNLFLNMGNELRLLNTSSAAAAVDLTINSYSGAGSSHSYNIPANGSLLLDLSDSSTYATSANTYGAVISSSLLPGQIQAEIIRTHTDPLSGLLDFSMPTSSR